jgi:hypothetical protein
MSLCCFVLLGIIKLNAVMLSAATPSVVAPRDCVAPHDSTKATASLLALWFPGSCPPHLRHENLNSRKRGKNLETTSKLCRMLKFVMLSFFLLTVIMLNVIMLNFITLNVVMLCRCAKFH